MMSKFFQTVRGARVIACIVALMLSCSLAQQKSYVDSLLLAGTGQVYFDTLAEVESCDWRQVARSYNIDHEYPTSIETGLEELERYDTEYPYAHVDCTSFVIYTNTQAQKYEIAYDLALAAEATACQEERVSLSCAETDIKNRMYFEPGLNESFWLTFIYSSEVWEVGPDQVAAPINLVVFDLSHDGYLQIFQLASWMNAEG